jgi:pimeloyl-ACP methyl ester carboxylesterase
MPVPVRSTPRAKTETSHRDDPLRPQNPLVERRWLLAGVAFILVGALTALYLALALLFWQGQWQLIFHPSHAVSTTPANAGVPFEDVRFDTTETGQPLLAGWWVPADSAANPGTAATFLYLHDARGSLSGALPDVLALHGLGANVFAFDPRGYGKSEWAKPSEARWREDAEAALAYLASLRHVPPQRVVVVGRGLAGTTAANLTRQHPELRSLIMIDPQPPTLALLQAPGWTHLLPVPLLAHDRFDPSEALRSGAVDKLFLLAPGAVLPAYAQSAVAPATVLQNATITDPRAKAAIRELLQQPR